MAEDVGAPPESALRPPLVPAAAEKRTKCVRLRSLLRTPRRFPQRGSAAQVQVAFAAGQADWAPVFDAWVAQDTVQQEFGSVLQGLAPEAKKILATRSIAPMAKAKSPRSRSVHDVP